MSTAEDKLASKLPAIQTALEMAITEAAGERMGYVLLVVPLQRVGDHIAVSNIASKSTIVRFLRDCARTMKADWLRMERYAEQMTKRGLRLDS